MLNFDMSLILFCRFILYRLRKPQSSTVNLKNNTKFHSLPLKASFFV